MGRVLVVACLLAGCTTERAADVHWVPSDGLVIDGADATLTFPLTRLLGSTPYVVALDNDGSSSVDFEADGGFGSFKWGPIHNVKVSAGAQLRIDLEFTPQKSQPVDELVVFANEQPFRLHLQGEGDLPTCDLPTDIDGGVGRRYGANPRVLRVNNGSRTTSTPEFIRQNELEVVPGKAEVDAGQHVDFTVRWTPTELGPYAGFIQGTASKECPLRVVRLTGVVLEESFTFDPVSIDCGSVSVNSSVSHEVRFTNRTGDALHITDAGFTGGTAFSVTPTELTVESEQQGVLTVTCSPTTQGRSNGSLLMATDFFSLPELRIPVAVTGVP